MIADARAFIRVQAATGPRRTDHAANEQKVVLVIEAFCHDGAGSLLFPAG
jgi:hypothetical protein